MIARIATLLVGGVTIGIALGAMLLSTLPVFIGFPVVFAVVVILVLAGAI